MAFTTWSALKTAFLDELADNPARAMALIYRTPMGTGVTARSFEDLTAFLRYIDEQIDAETDGIASTLGKFG